MRFFLLLFLLPLHVVFSAAPAEELIVDLKIAPSLVSTYLTGFSSSEPFLEKAYLDSLYKVLAFDIQYSGRMELRKVDENKEALFKTLSPKEIFANEMWKKEKIHYLIQSHFDKDSSTLHLYNVNYSYLKTIKIPALTGRFNEDRQKIHLLADQMHKLLFNIDGIASTKLLYTLQTPCKLPSQERPYQSSIWVCDYDGANAKQLTKVEHYCITPCFFPLKKEREPRFLYVSYEKGPSKIFIGSLDTSEREPLLSLRGNQLLPTISKDRSKLAFICDAGGRADLFVQAIHPEKGLIGKPIQAFSFPSSVQASPSFSPDGKQIAFVSDKDGTPRIYLIDTPHYSHGKKTPKATCVSKKNRDNTCPNWSPDGKKIAYSSLSDGIRQLWIYDFETKQESQLTFGPYHKENPCWAPNSLHIVFNTVDGDSSDLFLINLTDKEPIKITEGSGKKHYPAWQL